MPHPLLSLLLGIPFLLWLYFCEALVAYRQCNVVYDDDDDDETVGQSYVLSEHHVVNIWIADSIFTPAMLLRHRGSNLESFLEFSSRSDQLSDP